MSGRGALGKWGPNQAADPIVTRWNPEDSTELQVVVVKRKDTGEWALPGGMVDDGEAVSLTRPARCCPLNPLLLGLLR